jgi:hypothetical protein
MRTVLVAHLDNKRDVVIEQLRASFAPCPVGTGQG